MSKDKKLYLCECANGECADLDAEALERNRGCPHGEGKQTVGYFIPATRRRLERRVLRAAGITYDNMFIPKPANITTNLGDAVRALRAYDEKEKGK